MVSPRYAAFCFYLNFFKQAQSVGFARLWKVSKAVLVDETTRSRSYLFPSGKVPTGSSVAGFTIGMALQDSGKLLWPFK